MRKDSIKMIELFSGIGSQAKALERIGVNLEVVHTCEWNIHSMVAYDIIHKNGNIDTAVLNMGKDDLLNELSKYNLSNDGKTKMTINSLRAAPEKELSLIYSAILKTNNLVDITTVKGTDIIENLDILTYSFPCQDLSNVGAFHGYTNGIDRDAHTRSGLLWEVERILKEMTEENKKLPKFLLLENVPALQSKRHSKNFEEWQKFLENIGYYNHVYKLDALDFGLPQHRERLLMISVFTNNDSTIENRLKKYFNKSCNLQDSKYRQKRFKDKELCNFKQYSLEDILKLDYTNEIYMEEALESQPNDTPSRRNIWNDNPKLVNETGEVVAKFTATITTKQDRHPNSGNIYVDFNNGRSKFRYLTPRECFLLMGFDEEDFNKLKKSNQKFRKHSRFFTRDNLIKMAGNSIPVNVLELVFRQIIYIRKNILKI